MTEETPGVAKTPTLEELRSMLESLAREKAEEMVYSETSEYRDRLIQCHKSFVQEVPSFKPGDLVRWKEGLKNRTYPESGSVGIVVDYVPQNYAINAEKDPNSAFFREPLNLALGVLLHDDHRFVVYWFDARRFEYAGPA